jgi:hypothetical protein
MFKRTTGVLAAARLVDAVTWPLTLAAALWMKVLRTFGLQYLPANKHALMAVGVLPVRDHYYEPMINPAHLRYPLARDRNLSAIDLNIDEQMSLLDRFTFQEELLKIPLNKTKRLEFYYHNGSFESGDAEYLYSIIRLFKPKKIVEIGCGYSTLIAKNAVKENIDQEASYRCEHICIEPYEQPWLEELDVHLIRQRVEECDMSLFGSLGSNDILFIDSSHVIRPQGDVIFEYLEILPTLRAGVMIHIHDIFTPRDYLKEWIVDELKLWNEQYLLEAFLSHNRDFRIIGALNFLKHRNPELIADKLPILKREQFREPGSFWMIRN